jgi:RecA-family ATPase
MDQTTQSVPNPQPRYVARDVYDDPLSNAKRATGAFSLTRIDSRDLPWLWPGRIPLGCITLLVSDPGVGKSLLALDIAARVSRGAQWPDQCSPLAPREEIRLAERDAYTPASVLLINIEDHFAHTIRPRLEALGADFERIIGLTEVREEPFFEYHQFALTRDLNALQKLIEAMQGCRLVILDPITALLGNSTDQSSADVWKLLTALAGLARKLSFAVLVVSHLRKKEGAAIHRALGSLAFVAAARVVWTLAKDPADSNKRLFIPLKNNFAPDTKGLAFTIETHEPTQAATIRWHAEPIEVTASMMLPSARPGGRPDEERRYAMEWLRARLSDGAAPMCDVQQEANAHGICYGTLRRAFRQLGGEPVKKGEVKHGQWLWRLPSQDAQNPVGEICAS